MQLNENLGWILGGGTLLVLSPVLLRVIRAGWRIARTAYETYTAAGEKIRARNAHLILVTEADLEATTKQYVAVCTENAALRQLLVDEACKVKLRDDVNDQDRFTIRLLMARMDERNIDYSDIQATVRKSMMEKWRNEHSDKPRT